jgi:hypothetical protein
VSGDYPTARQLGLMSCHVCGQLAQAPDTTNRSLRCPRCGTPMHMRKHASLSTTWALIAAAILLYVPANLLPMMVTASLLGSQEDTIMSGVVFLWQSGSWPLATVVFFASVMVPLLKIIALIYLTASAQRRSRHNLTPAHAPVPAGGICRSLVDARHLRHHHSGGAGSVPGARHHPGRPCSSGIRGGGRRNDVCGDELRPPSYLGPPLRSHPTSARP